MARNVEIKARVRDMAALHDAASALATEPVRELIQHDVFYAARTGRLKLRRFPDGVGELIHYDRPDAAGPKTSRYAIFRTTDGAGLAALLGAALPVVGEVHKVRTLVMAGRTRIHLDEVTGLGSFLELEVVLADGEDAAAGESEAHDLMARLGVAPADLVEGAYLDLMRDGGR